ncbi:LuxR C-terminal-related transcriptional regulator [Microbispora siamensis]|uniref:LuxR C-terminal-related transcriptional regulator n=1 Tax=Microbispora siamensis TaxID=564413 RepID=UPI00194DC90F|nr:LuxR C-terminal-related transcriptional regulator [Microbispora siamensis]
MGDRSVLGAVGVTDFDERLYRLVLRRPGGRTADLAAELGVGPARVRPGLARLADAGLLRRAGPGRYEAVPPEAAIEWLVDRRRLETEARLAAVRTVVSDFAQLYHSGRLGAARAGVVEVLAGEEAVKRVMSELQRTVGVELLGFDRPPYVGRPDDSADTNESELAGTRQLLARGVDIRVVYCPESLDRPGRLETLIRLAEEGERSRFVAHLPFKLRIADRKIGLFPLVDGVYDHIALLHPSRLLDALVELFDVYWERGRPLAGLPHVAEERPAEEDLLVLRLLNAGLKDEAIGRHLGVSARTATRKIAAVLERLGVTTRFQAGAEAAARGWL